MIETYFEDWFVSAVDQTMCLKRVALSEPGVTYVALVRLLTCGHSETLAQTLTNSSRLQTGMYSEMPFQFVCVRTGVRAVRALIRPFAGVAAHVPLQFGQLYRRVVAFGAPMRLLVGVSVADVSDQLSRGGERRVTVFTAMWANTRMGVDVILKRCDCLQPRERLKDWDREADDANLEPSLTNATLVRPFLAVRLHVSRQ